MTSKEYEQRLEALEREIAALRQETVEDESTPKPPHQRPNLNHEEPFYLVGSNGNIFSSSWCNNSWDGGRFAVGNVFLTKEAAEYAAEYLKVLAEMREWAGNWDDPWRLAYVNGPIGAVTVYSGKKITYGELRFACKEDAENCIKAVGKDRLIKYYFGVRDHEIPAETE